MITSTSNPKIKHLVQLQKKSRLRSDEKVFITEGIRMFAEAPSELIREIYVSETFYQKESENLPDRGLHIEILADHVFSHVSDTKTPQGILCVVGMPQYSLKDIVKTKEIPQLLVLDNLQDPGNVGTILRTAEGAGVTGVILSSECVDMFNPKTIRSTMGAIYRVPFVYVEDLSETLILLKEEGIRTFAAHLEGAVNYEEENYRPAAAFLLGNEGNGLRQSIAESADAWIKIPMCGGLESLNVAIAASILMFEAARQRRM